MTTRFESSIASPVSSATIDESMGMPFKRPDNIPEDRARLCAIRSQHGDCRDLTRCQELRVISECRQKDRNCRESARLSATSPDNQSRLVEVCHRAAMAARGGAINARIVGAHGEREQGRKKGSPRRPGRPSEVRREQVVVVEGLENIHRGAPSAPARYWESVGAPSLGSRLILSAASTRTLELARRVISCELTSRPATSAA